MPEAPDPKKPAETKKVAPKPAAGKASAGPDVATLAGIALAVGGIIGGLILEKGSLQDIAQATAALIVFGGTMGAVLVTNPLPVFMRALKLLRFVFWRSVPPASATIEMLIQFATKARKNGIVSLESDAATVADPFLRKALGLAVDGTDLQELRKIMEIDIHLSEQAGDAEAKVWESAGGYAPTVGIIGAVMGLIQVMKHLEDIKEVGHGIAVAFVATVYGVGCANIFFLPAAAKLRARVRAQSQFEDMMLEGVIGIVEGLNPTLIRLKLDAFNDAPKPAAKKAPAKPAPEKKAPAPQPAKAPAAGV